MGQSVYSLEPIEDVDLNSEERLDATEKSTQEISTETVESRDVSGRIEGVVEKSHSEKDGAYSKILSDVQSAPPSDDVIADISQDASEVHQQMDYESQLQHLIDLAVTKGVLHSVQVAEHLNDYYMLDRLHDQLVHDDLHQKLVDHGMISPPT